MANSTGSRAPITGATLAGNRWHYATPGMTTTTTSALNGGNGTAGDFVRAGMLAKFGKQAVDNYLAAKAAEEALGGAVGMAGNEAAQGAATSGLFGASGAAAGQLGGEILPSGSEAIADAIKSGLWAPPGEASQVVGGLAAAPLDGGINLASQSGQAVGEAASNIYGDIAGQAAEKAAETAGNGILSQAAEYLPYVGGTLKLGADIASGNYGGAAGSTAGAVLGSFVPVVGPVLGGTIGGILGSFIR